jgi:hypothetical protein
VGGWVVVDLSPDLIIGRTASLGACLIRTAHIALGS